MTYQTLYCVRPGYDGARIDWIFQWERVDGGLEELVRAGQVAARMEGKPIPSDMDAAASICPEGVEAARCYATMKMRCLLGHAEGPYLVSSDHRPSDEELLAHWRTKRK